jgi:DNA mismatch repair protein MutS
MAKTPMMQQYDEAKQACGNALLLFRMGDFYELFHEDAKQGAELLGLALTSRDKGENPIPMAGFPHHQLDNYLARLIAAGRRVAVCEQVQDPREATGLVRREVTRIVSPGTVTDDALLDPTEANYLAGVVTAAGDSGKETDNVGLAWADLSTGRFCAASFPRSQLMDQLTRIGPSECLLVEDNEELAAMLAGTGMLTPRPEWSFGLDAASRSLTSQFGTSSLEGFGFDDHDLDRLAIRAAGAVLQYLQETQGTSLDHFQRLVPYRQGETVEIDAATWQSLEITRTMRDGSRDGSLLSVMDHTVTAMGSRLLADWLANPLTSVPSIVARHDALEELIATTASRDRIRQQLRGIYDLQRLLARIATGRASPRDLSHVGRTLGQLPELLEQLADPSSSLLKELVEQVDLCPELTEEIAAALVEDCPLHARDGGIIRDGYSKELDRLRKLVAGGKQWIAEYQASEIERSGISSLKVGFNKVFGYYLEVTNTHRDKVPETYIRKQTLKNAERFITPELKEYEEAILSADDKARDLEYSLFQEIRQLVHDAGSRLQQTAIQLATLDLLTGLAELSTQRGYCRPTMTSEPVLEIRDGRHPVLDVTEPEGTFVPNDIEASPDRKLLLLITGPNMAGKSTYIRQVALITLMAQVGSFVPATTATIGIADRIFARVGASDELSRGQSTFMVEMTETARILNTATSQSLIILDEIGRGTSTYDGVSLAWAIIEHIHHQIGCRTFFATHYHELTDLEATLGLVKNLNVAVKEWDDKVAFLHKIVEGSADKSYGIHVARLAGIPRQVNDRAREILTRLESDHQASLTPLASSRTAPAADSLQMTLFQYADHPLLDQLRQLNLDQLSPLEALQLLHEWQQKLEVRD